MTDEAQTPTTTAAEPPKAAGDSIALGWRHYADHKYAEAEAAFRNAIGLDSRLIDAQYGLAMAYARQGEREKALEALKKAQMMVKDNATVVNSAHKTMLNLVITSQIAILTGKNPQGF